MDPVTIKILQMALQAAKNSKTFRYFIIGLIIIIFCSLSFVFTFLILVTSVGQVPSLSVSSNLVEFIENHEGFSATPYRGVDAQNLTIGYGHVIQPSELSKYTTLTKDQAETLLMNDLNTDVSSVQNEFQNLNLSQNQYDALVDLSYNLGQNIWDGIDLTTDIKAGASADVIKIDFECLDSCNGTVVQGLVNRRNDEYEMFEYGIYAGVSDSSSVPQK